MSEAPLYRNVGHAHNTVLAKVDDLFCQNRQFLPRFSILADRFSVQRVDGGARLGQREFLIDNRLVQIHLIIVMIWWTDLALWDY